MYRFQVERSIRKGVSRAGCHLVEMTINPESFTLTVKAKETDTVAIVGEWINYNIFTYDEIANRVVRFCKHEVLKQPYHEIKVLRSIP